MLEDTEMMCRDSGSGEEMGFQALIKILLFLDVTDADNKTPVVSFVALL